MWRTSRRPSCSPSSTSRRRRRVQCRQRRGSLRHRGGAAPRPGHGQEHRARDRRQGARRRHPPLHRGHRARSATSSGYAPRRDFSEGLAELAEWVAEQEAEDRVAGGAARARGAGSRRMTSVATPMRRAGRPAPAPVLVTGGAGFIGSNLADRFAREGHDVLVFDALARPGVERNLAWLEAASSRADHGRHRRRPRRDEPRRRCRDAQAVFHMAAQVAVTTSLADPREDFDVNVRGTLHLLDALRRRSEPVPLDLRLDQQGLWRPRSTSHSTRPTMPMCRAIPAIRATGIGESAPARLPHALRLLEGRGRPVRPRLCALLRRADGACCA